MKFSDMNLPKGGKSASEVSVLNVALSSNNFTETTPFIKTKL